jgi:hypothetical protein
MLSLTAWNFEATLLFGLKEKKTMKIFFDVADTRLIYSQQSSKQNFFGV